MGWVTIGTYQITDNYTYTSLIEGEIFQIIHQSISNASNEYLKATIGQSFIDEDGEVNVFDLELLSYSDKRQTKTFYFPAGISQHSLAFRRLDNSSIPWTITIRIFEADNKSASLANYLTGRFGAQTLMALYSNPVSAITLLRDSLQVISRDVAITSNVVVELAAPNPNRAILSIYNPVGKDLLLSLFATGSAPNLVLGSLVALVKNTVVFQLPTSQDGSIWQGAIYGKLTGSNGVIAVTEFSYPT